MLPFVLGGIALAAVGYGVKEYCESEGCPWDEDDTSSKERNAFESFYTSKMHLYRGRFEELRTILLKVEHTDFVVDEEFTLLEEKLSSSKITEEMKVQINLHEEMLDYSSNVLGKYVSILAKFVNSSTDYEQYDKSQKKLVKRAFKVLGSVQNLLSLRLLDANGEVNVKSIVKLREFKSLMYKQEQKIDAALRQNVMNYTMFLTGSGMAENMG